MEDATRWVAPAPEQSYRRLVGGLLGEALAGNHGTENRPRNLRMQGMTTQSVFSSVNPAGSVMFPFTNQQLLPEARAHTPCRGLPLLFKELLQTREHHSPVLFGMRAGFFVRIVVLSERDMGAAFHRR